jgi:hypothetical protein
MNLAWGTCSYPTRWRVARRRSGVIVAGPPQTRLAAIADARSLFDGFGRLHECSTRIWKLCMLVLACKATKSM